MDFINKIVLRGIVGRATTTTCGETTMCRFSLVTRYGCLDKSGNVTFQDTWHSVTFPNPQGITIERGDWVEVEGRLRAQRYADGDGIDRLTWDVYASKVEVLKKD